MQSCFIWPKNREIRRFGNATISARRILSSARPSQCTIIRIKVKENHSRAEFKFVPYDISEEQDKSQKH